MMYDASITFKASSNMIRLNIGNLLNLKQLEMESFVKDVSTFNIVESVQEVINIQEHQATSRNVRIVPHFFGFSPNSELRQHCLQGAEILDYADFDMNVTTDETRIQ
jgi:signal transduction histidine kinase